MNTNCDVKTPMTSFLRILSVQLGRFFFPPEKEEEKSEKEKESRQASATRIPSSLAPLSTIRSSLVSSPQRTASFLPGCIMYIKT